MSDQAQPKNFAALKTQHTERNILATAIVYIISKYNQRFPCRVLLDGGSQINMISERKVHMTGLERHYAPIQCSNKTVGTSNFKFELESRAWDVDTKGRGFVSEVERRCQILESNLSSVSLVLVLVELESRAWDVDTKGRGFVSEICLFDKIYYYYYCLLLCHVKKSFLVLLLYHLKGKRYWLKYHNLKYYARFLISKQLATPTDMLKNMFPNLKEELNISNYENRFQTLLYLVEMNCLVNLRKYDSQRAHFTREGRYLALTIENLSVRRPSLVIGDMVKAENPWADARI
uniref:Uncharacterized protein n=1 Tax=Glossina palpalis gambiensis TaxID=67801 RepID=A0A1B0BYB1_9MUSC